MVGMYLLCVGFFNGSDPLDPEVGIDVTGQILPDLNSSPEYERHLTHVARVDLLIFVSSEEKKKGVRNPFISCCCCFASTMSREERATDNAKALGRRTVDPDADANGDAGGGQLTEKRRCSRC